MINLDDWADRVRERLNRSIGQRCRYHKAMIAFQVDVDLAWIDRFVIDTNKPTFSFEIANSAITNEKIGRQRWDANEVPGTSMEKRHGDEETCEEARKAGQDRRQGQARLLKNPRSIDWSEVRTGLGARSYSTEEK